MITYSRKYQTEVEAIIKKLNMNGISTENVKSIEFKGGGDSVKFFMVELYNTSEPMVVEVTGENVEIVEES